MPLFANGPAYQKYTVGTAPTLVLSTRGFGGTAIAPGITMRNPALLNAGTVSLYISAGTIIAQGGTPSALQLLGSGGDIPPGSQFIVTASTVMGTAPTLGTGIFDVFGCTAGSGTTVIVESGYLTQLAGS